MAGFVGGNDGYIPMLELSGNLLIEFSRNMEKSVNRYSRITPVQKSRGAYLYFDPLSLVPLKNLPQGPTWAPGTLRPTGFHRTLGFTEYTFQTERYNFPITLDKRSTDLANWPVMKSHSSALAQEAMTHRAYSTAVQLTTTGNFPASHVVSATSLGGGFLDAGTTAAPYILKALQAAARVIQKDSMGRVRWGQLTVVMNHNTALRLSASRELREYLMQQVNAREMIELKPGNFNAAYGLPNTLYGFKVVVEDAYYNADNRGNASAAPTVVFPDNTISICVTDGDLEKSEGSADYNTVHNFVYEDMTVETNEDARNRLVYLDIVCDFVSKVVAPVTGFIITNVFS